MLPVFIGGCSRSGTHMLGAMLGAHSRCISPPECTYKFSVLHACRGRVDTERLSRAARMLMNTQSYWNWELSLKPNDVPVEAFDGEPRRLLEWLVQHYATVVDKENPDIWIDHTPANTRYVCTLMEAFPEAKIIHLVRDGRAVAASVLPIDFGPNSTPRAGIWWVQSLSYGLASEVMLGVDQAMRVRYEDLVTEPDRMMEQISAFIGVDPEPEMVSDAGYRTPSHLRKTHALVGKRPDPSRLNLWERRLTPRQIELFEAYSGQMLRYLGYEMKHGGAARLMTNRESLKTFLGEAWRSFVVNPLRSRHRLTLTRPSK